MLNFEIAIATGHGLILFQFCKFSIDHQVKYLVTSKTRNLDFVMEKNAGRWQVLKDHDYLSVPDWVIGIEPALDAEITRHHFAE